jgi:hypothetical protein
MSLTYIPAELRRLVIARAVSICEYCLVAEEDTFLRLEVDHVIGEKHGGPTTADNLACACFHCNRAKGSDIGSLDWDGGTFVRFFNPRTDRWADHFALAGARIDTRTAIGSVTARILEFNAAPRLFAREAMLAVARYPSPAALRRMAE